jgi:asparagine synthase (glutamine-hydrolysing)
MCGIAGIVRFDGAPTPPGVLERMTGALAHRGPEASGIQWISDGRAQVGLGHARLKIIDLSDAAGQPMANDDGSVWLVFNGEIYNYPELRAELQRGGVRFRSSSDTEVLLRLYEREGPACVERLDGMFAFAVWDRRRRQLLLARDRVGKKPLFYVQGPRFLAFASEIKALLRHPEIPAQVDAEALPALFLYGYVPTPATCYAGIRKLPAGHRMQVMTDGTARLEEYWDLPMPAPASRAPSDAEAADRVRALVTAAVQRRLIADVPLGAFLSGGLDSSIVVGLMSHLLREPVRTFSIGFSTDRRFDETAYARLVAQRFGTLHTEFIVEPSSVGLLESLVWHFDGPFADSSAVPTYLLSRLTRQHVTVALNGDGGDELFAGYLRFAAARLSERVPLWLRHGARSALGLFPEWGHHASPLRRLKKFAASASLPLADRFTRWVSVFYDDLPNLLEPGPRGGGRSRPSALALLDPHLQQCAAASPLARLLYVNAKTYLLDDLLVKMDRCSMAHALEARSPFLDRDLLEYVFRLPDGMKLRGLRTKLILRRALADLVPPEVLRRGKMGFGVPLQRWFGGQLRPLLHELLLSPAARLRAYLHQPYVAQVCREHWSGWADHSHRLWTLLTFEMWLRNLALDPVGPADGCSGGSQTPQEAAVA